jgi:hypothetical protein
MQMYMDTPEVQANIKLFGLGSIIDESIPPFHTEFAAAGR